MGKKGLFITFEGIDGSGKTTQLELLYGDLLSTGIHAIKTREPGGTALGEKVRALLADDHLDILPHTELLLFFSSRAQLMGSLILPAIKRGRLILCDRFHDATVAYQGYGRGLGMDIIAMLEKAFVGTVRPDRTYLLDCPYEIAKKRLLCRSAQERIEFMDKSFFERVRKGYLALAGKEKGRIVVIDAGSGIDPIHRQIREDFFKWAGL
ncbi:MAG: dTMP kinase [Deltaproteobacteria bacterium]|nr:dTMP kinase [Deltaproteobacteria bacterium]MCL5276927.1 dTMP kinase [Deltaproteobacteria bacterium]